MVNNESVEINIPNKVSLLQDGIVLFVGSPKPTPENIKLAFEEIEKFGKSNGNSFSLLFDLDRCGLPDARTRKEINTSFLKIQPFLKHIAYSTGKNLLIIAAIKFVMYGMGLNSYTIHKNKEEALEEILKRHAA